MAQAGKLIIPEVYADLVREKMIGRTKVAQLATQLGYLSNTNIGEVVTFPRYKLISDVEDFVKGTPITSEELEQTSSQAKIKMVAKGVHVYDIDDMTALGNAVEEAITQQSLKFARKLDADLVDCCLQSPLKVDTALGNSITADELNKGLLLFGDEADIEDINIVINSLLIPSFLKMPEFIDGSKTFNTDGNGVQKKGCIGCFRGIGVYVADHKTYDSVNSTAITLIVKNGALAYIPKRDINIELERQASYKRTNIVGDFVYSTALINDGGVIVLKKGTVVTP
ncbi:hypothetical protein [Clostridium cylindrosporum]|uniref:Uncharacterized protein n=1 Tax=Clostridium cylindrosporum DSM 605 TaxID=1121307 RepID=A0A0J8D6N8_CLOCY|nr:hypothetical protein [Clostridium cylindrosporum]KMT21502.1 hypothetical protein CLCY_2c02630 [Clostridium cylindrosporum DSM 605]